MHYSLELSRYLRSTIVGIIVVSLLSFVIQADAAETLLKKGSKGDMVLSVQTQLKELGYYDGSLTGNFGSLTEEATGLSWECKFISLDKHADGEPITSKDTDTMYTAFGKTNTWTPKAVWYTMPDGKTYIGSIHNMPHGTDKIKDNNFKGILCMHFPREMAEAEKTGDYAVKHQKAILSGWEKTQNM